MTVKALVAAQSTQIGTDVISERGAALSALAAARNPL